jgi:hypothetical protein
MPKGKKSNKSVSETVELASNLNISERDMTIAMLRAKDVSMRKIGAEVGIGKSRVAAICKRDDVRSVIETEQRRLVSLVPSAVDNYKAWISKGSITNDKDMRDIAFKASTKVLESTGLLTGNASIQIQNVYNNNNTVISPVIMNLLGEFSKSLNSFDDVNEVIDGEFSEITQEAPESTVEDCMV